MNDDIDSLTQTRAAATLDARLFARPLAFFANGYGDTLLVLPALRALSQRFEGRLRLIHSAGPHAAVFDELPLAERLALPLWRGDDQQPAFDLALARGVTEDADLFVSLTPWRSPSLLNLARTCPGLKVGYFDDYDLHIRLDRSIHTADSMFKAAQLFGAGDLERFAGPVRLPQDAAAFIRSIRQAAPAGGRVLCVHLDTLKSKMCPPQIVERILTRFLAEHPHYVALVVGTEPQALDLGAWAGRVFDCCGLALAESFAVVQGADLFLGVDSCMLHMADLSRVPGVGLFGPTAAHEFGFRFSPGAIVSYAAGDEAAAETAVLELGRRAI